MDLIYCQIGFKEDEETRTKVYFTVRQILWRLRNYTDNGPIPMEGPMRFITVADSKDGLEIMNVLQNLEEHKILQFRHTPKSPALLFEIFVTNRYKLDLLLAETKWLGEEIDKRSDFPKIENLVYYDLKSGRGLINGKPVYLKGRNKKVFNILYRSAPNPVDKELLKSPVKTDHKDDDTKFAMNDAISLLRKACKVDSSVISLRKGYCWLNAKVFPLSVQLFEGAFSNEEK